MTCRRRALPQIAAARGLRRRPYQSNIIYKYGQKTVRGRAVAEKEAAARRAADTQVLEDAERLIGAWNERQAKRMPMLFLPTIGTAIAARHWFLWERCPACRTINAIDLRKLDRHRGAAVTDTTGAVVQVERAVHQAYPCIGKPFCGVVARPRKLELLTSKSQHRF